MSEQKVLIAMPVDHPGYVVPGSLRWICHECRGYSSCLKNGLGRY